jgi:hypothetical protein
MYQPQWHISSTEATPPGDAAGSRLRRSTELIKQLTVCFAVPLITRYRFEREKCVTLRSQVCDVFVIHNLGVVCILCSIPVRSDHGNKTVSH